MTTLMYGHSRLEDSRVIALVNRTTLVLPMFLRKNNTLDLAVRLLDLESQLTAEITESAKNQLAQQI